MHEIELHEEAWAHALAERAADCAKAELVSAERVAADGALAEAKAEQRVEVQDPEAMAQEMKERAELGEVAEYEKSMVAAINIMGTSMQSFAEKMSWKLTEPREEDRG